ncbi:MAG: SDR family NAD(P)-dependent oxidoreductase, partial [Anaerolineales bacterium]|nr:SDR family NAD(P)-dependent oxidoreductase [Anaerolineales bacterium]
GATSGIGLALAHELHTAGHKLILLGRKPLHSLSDPLFTPENYCQTDLSHPDAAQHVRTWLDSHAIQHLDLLIHNAGLGYYGSPATQSAHHIQDLIQVNLNAPIALTHALYPWLLRGERHIVFVSSVSSVLPTAEYATYTASKAALDGFARSLRLELGQNWTVQVLHPGATATPMHAKVGMPVEKTANFAPVEQVAAEMWAAIQSAHGRNIAIGTGNKILRGVGQTLPQPLEWVMGRTSKIDPPPRFAPTQYPRHALITGFADGIGRALAVRFAQAGYHLTGIDVDADRAADTAVFIQSQNGHITYHLADLSQPADLAPLAAKLGQGRPFDVVIHNAGISAAGHFVDLPLVRQLKVIDVNLTAPLVLTAQLLADGALVRQGHIVLLSSLSYYVGYPGAAVYAASKDGLALYGRALAAALAPDIHLHTVFPGPTRTAHARRYSPDNSREERRMPPEDVAQAVFTAVQKNQRLVLPGPAAKLFATLGKLAPTVMEQAMKKTLLDKMPRGEP